MKSGSTSIDVAIHSSLSEAQADWQQPKDAPGNIPYQSFDWLTAWTETLGKTHDENLVIAIGRIEGEPVVLLPFGLRKTTGVKTLSFLGSEFGNQNTGCWDPSFYADATSEQVMSLLIETAKQSGADLVSLQNVPEAWLGRRHPLLLETSTSSPSPIFTRNLMTDFDTLFKDTHSKSARKNLLRKQRHLQSSEGYRVVKAHTEEDIARGFAAFLEQRSLRASAAGIPNAFSEPAAQDFLSRLLGLPNVNTGDNTPVMDLWFLEAEGAIRATYLCLEHSETIYAYGNSVAHDEMLPNSPGLVLIKEIIDYACAAPELNILDLGLGEERYKTAWAEPLPLKDSMLAITLTGKARMQFDFARTRAKSAIRNSEVFWPLVRRLRKWKAGLGKSASSSD
ncbi:MAG: GNAT family N-acetyltransferase [Roseibium sp.]|uniref:GNAT family N-acetyltransferase n=1 Tax=Roseibium sp. TaxID=1936156 RepID=UPI0026093D66|nr:GNAT family N-acetyltransferase [Roseibium sp.]MCV0424435.1 GNAT family N-acetyltransferase [Roseibium sp.]